jgi:hypothetical protein
MIVSVRRVNFEKESLKNWRKQAILKENHHQKNWRWTNFNKNAIANIKSA